MLLLRNFEYQADLDQHIFCLLFVCVLSKTITAAKQTNWQEAGFPISALVRNRMSREYAWRKTIFLNHTIYLMPNV